MLNNKRFSLFEGKKEQKYLKNLISKINNPKIYKTYKKMYEDFEKIISFEELEIFIKKYKININLDKNKTINEIKEEIAYELIESIYKNINS